MAVVGVAVEGEAVHKMAITSGGVGHEDFGPAVVGFVGTTSNFVDVVVTKVADVGLKLAVLVGIVFGAHVAATAPVFVANTPVFYFPGFFASVLTAQVGHGADAIEGDVFDPLLHFLYGTTADITANVGFGFELFA